MMRMMLLLCALLCLPRALADEVVFYRCTDGSGALTMQNMPCPKGHKQEKKVMQGVSTVPMGAPKPAAPAPSAAVAAPVPTATTQAGVNAADPVAASAAAADEEVDELEKAAPLPPPVLFQCTTYDKDTYITESDEPQSRCVALQTVGLDGNPQGGAGEACEMKRDQCARVGDTALCDAWKKRLGETEVAWRFARAGNEQKNREEFERTRRIWHASTCSR